MLKEKLSGSPIWRNATYFGIALAAIFIGIPVGCNIKPSSHKHASSVIENISPGALPDSRLTPGDVLDVSRDDICTPGFTKKIRRVPSGLKKKVYLSYGRVKENLICCEVDHLIPLELGGSNRETNLWPEPYDGLWNAQAKDRLESHLHQLVCAGDVDLHTAQKEMASNWIKAYQKYLGTVP